MPATDPGGMRARLDLNSLLRAAALACPLALVLLLAWTPGISFQEDLGRHLLLGKIIFREHFIPRTNYLSYTYPEFPFVNHHWLAEVVLYLIHRLGNINAMIVWKMLMMGGALALAMCTGRPRRETGAYWLAGTLAAVILGYRTHIRPELFSFLFVGVYLCCFRMIREGAGWPRWLVTGIAWFWANTHIYFIFGLGMIAAFFMERMLTRGPGGPEGGPGGGRVRGEAAWLAAAMLVSCLNPNGLEGLLYPFRILSNYGMEVVENDSPLKCWQSVLNPMLLALPPFSVFVLVSLVGNVRRAVSLSRFRRGLAYDLIAAAALVAAWWMVRNVALLALAGLPVIGRWLQSREEERGAGRAAEGGGRARSLIAPVALLVLTFWLGREVVSGRYSRTFPAPLYPPPFGFDDERRFEQLRVLQQVYGLKGPVFNNFNIGSLLEYEMYPERSYIDGRPEAFPASFFQSEYRAAMALGKEWDEISARRGFNAVIISPWSVPGKFTRELMGKPQWRLVHLDEIFAVWVRDAPENRKIIEALLFDSRRRASYLEDIERRIAGLGNMPPWRRTVEAENILYRLSGLYALGEIEGVWRCSRELYSLFPESHMLQELMMFTAPREELGFLGGILERRARWPVSAKQVVAFSLYQQLLGRLEKAEEVLRRGRLFFPLSPAIRDGLASLERQRGSPSR